MNTQQNNFSFDTVFKALKPYVQRMAQRHVWRGVVALMCCHSALALDINQANEAELDSIKGMGPALSTKVLKARALGAFKDWSDLMRRVSGIRQSKAQQFSEQGLTVNGQTFTSKP